MVETQIIGWMDATDFKRNFIERAQVLSGRKSAEADLMN